MLACEVDFLFAYCSRPVDSMAVSGEAMQVYLGNILLILNHFLAYGCKKDYWELLRENVDDHSIKFVDTLEVDADEKGLNFLLLALSEPNLLQTVLTKVLASNQLLCEYSEMSLLLKEKMRILHISRAIYSQHLVVSGDL